MCEVPEMKLTIEDYSDKACVVRGEDTKKYKDVIKKYGGKWNTKLRGGPGWIIPKWRRDQMKEGLCEYRSLKKHLSVKRSGYSYHKPQRKDEETGLWICRKGQGLWHEDKECVELTDNPCGLCPKHHSEFGRDHKKGHGCFEMTGRWYKYEQDGEVWYKCR